MTYSVRKDRRCFSRTVTLFSLIFVTLAFCVPAAADSITFTLGTPNASLSSSPAPYAQVSLNLVGNAITVSVTMLGTYGIAGGGPAFGLNGPSGLTAGNFAFNTPNFSCCNPSGSGYGTFMYVIKGPSPGSNPPKSLSFTVTAPSGFNGGAGFSSVSQLGNQFMVHVITPNGAATGYATVPDGDPSTLALLALSLGGVSVLVVARKVKTG